MLVQGLTVQDVGAAVDLQKNIDEIYSQDNVLSILKLRRASGMLIPRGRIV